MKVYLAHPETHRKEGKYLGGLLEGLGFTVINPFEALANLQSKYRQTHNPFFAFKIVESEKILIESCDVVVAYSPEPSFGKDMEILWANIAHKPTYILTTTQWANHPWLVTHGTIVTSEQSLINKLRPCRIALCGYMGSGKTTVAQILKEKYNFKIYSFAQKLKEILKELYGVSKEDSRFRDIAQNFADGTLKIDPYTWVRFLCSRIDMEKPWRCVVDDLRFMREAEALKQRGFIIVRLKCGLSTLKKRNPSGFSLSTLKHPSEIEHTKIVSDYELNTDMSLEDFTVQLDSFMKNVLGVE
ncbi:MAG: AAA family ATPase [Candidatus Thermoplasmatota archaeon]|jgi:adenylylsulfate kinase-like enzyme|nr:AAA family ATPase [Candidatus Thermoplasmatota archaeon]